MRRPHVIHRAAIDPGHSGLAVPHGRDLTSSIVDLAENLLAEETPSTSIAEGALLQLRRRTRATEATLWSITDRRARRVLCAGRRPPDAAASVVELSAAARDRLRLTESIVCRFGEVSGVEELIPDGVASFVVTPVMSRGAVSGALVLGWPNGMPRWDGENLRHLRIVAGLLSRVPTGPGETSDSLVADAVLGSLPDRIAVVDHDGTILRVNAAWTESGRLDALGYPADIVPGANYFALCRSAAANGAPEAAEILAGVEAVCRGTSESFETVYACRAAPRERWSAVTVTPLRHRDGAAVIAYSDITPDRVMHLARRHGDEMFHRLADTLPVPLWILAPDGRLLFANQRGVEATGGRGANGDGEWTTAFHADDRLRAIAAFRSAVSSGGSFSIELRLGAADATFRWSACIGSPLYASDGRVESVIVFCYDTSAKHRAESTLSHIAAKLITAQEHERSRIARELHDDLGQQVALLASKLDFAARREGSRTRVQAGLADAHKTVQDLATSVHNLSHELHPAKLRLLGLGPTLASLCRNVSAESNVPVAFDRGEIPPDVPEEVALCVFRLTQEALHNAVKHSRARNIAVHVTCAPDHLALRISDDGTGFDPLASQSAGLGLLTMRERVELVGGKLTIDTAHDRGTMIEAMLPLAAPSPDVNHGRDESSGELDIERNEPDPVV